jgi:hypothetical protein
VQGALYRRQWVGGVPEHSLNHECAGASAGPGDVTTPVSLLPGSRVMWPLVCRPGMTPSWPSAPTPLSAPSTTSVPPRPVLRARGRCEPRPQLRDAQPRTHDEDGTAWVQASGLSVLPCGRLWWRGAPSRDRLGRSVPSCPSALELWRCGDLRCQRRAETLKIPLGSHIGSNNEPCFRMGGPIDPTGS